MRGQVAQSAGGFRRKTATLAGKAELQGIGVPCHRQLRVYIGKGARLGAGVETETAQQRRGIGTLDGKGKIDTGERPQCADPA